MLVHKILNFFLPCFVTLFISLDFVYAAETSAKAESGVNFVSAIAIAVVAASVLVIIFFKLNQPQILAYLATGVILQFFSFFVIN